MEPNEINPNTPETGNSPNEINPNTPETGNNPNEINPNTPETGSNPNEINPNMPETGNSPNEINPNTPETGSDPNEINPNIQRPAEYEDDTRHQRELRLPENAEGKKEGYAEEPSQEYIPELNGHEKYQKNYQDNEQPPIAE